MVLLVVDAQNGIVDERLYEFRKFVGNIKKADWSSSRTRHRSYLCTA